jgi:hypothetical protein
MAFWNRRRSIDAMLAPHDAPALKKTLGWPHLMALGVGAITIIGCIVFFFSLRPSTQLYCLYWNIAGLVVYFGWSAWNSRLAGGEETAG